MSISERKARHFALYRIKGMVRNLVEIEMDVPLSDMEVEYVNFLRETAQELIAKWGTVRWNHGSTRRGR